MFVRVIPNNKGKKKFYFCNLVESFRDQHSTPKHRIVKYRCIIDKNVNKKIWQSFLFH